MDVRAIGVVGCGLMGSGIAEVAALAGFEVVVVKATAGSLEPAIKRVESSLDRSVQKGKLSQADRDAARARLTFVGDLDALAKCDLIVESTAETLASKKKILADIEAASKPGAIIGTNTSSLPLAELAASLKNPERFVGLHFFSPVPMMKLVEVGRVAQTTGEVVKATLSTCEKLSKTPVLLDAEPGYIVNRLLVPYLCQAIEMLEQKVARAGDIDTAMKLGCGHPLGPLALSDLIGLDIVLAMATTLEKELKDTRFTAPALLKRLVAAGNLGKKTKLGLYDYRGAEPVENPEVRAAKGAGDLSAVGE